jgi:hypothetical protein
MRAGWLVRNRGQSGIVHDKLPAAGSVRKAPSGMDRRRGAYRIENYASWNVFRETVRGCMIQADPSRESKKMAVRTGKALDAFPIPTAAAFGPHPRHELRLNRTQEFDSLPMKRPAQVCKRLFEKTAIEGRPGTLLHMQARAARRARKSRIVHQTSAMRCNSFIFRKMADGKQGAQPDV